MSASAARVGSALPVGDGETLIDPFTQGVTGNWQPVYVSYGGDPSEEGLLYVLSDRSAALLRTYQNCGTSCGEQVRALNITLILNPSQTAQINLLRSKPFDSGSTLWVSNNSPLDGIMMADDGQPASVGNISFNAMSLSLEDPTPWDAKTCSTPLERQMARGESLNIQVAGKAYSFPLMGSASVEGCIG